jgi:AcrR family transcriptional regulator
MILQRSAQVFNRRGYFGASMSDIMEATGLEKGGIYNYFQSKDDLALQAFDYSVDLYRQEFAAAIKGKFDAIDRLNGIVAVFYGMVKGYPLPGGCPVMNTALEADDAHPVLRERALDAMQEWYDFIKRIVQRGIERNQIRGNVDADEAASIIYSMLEGGVMVTRLTGEMVHLDRVVGHMSKYLESSLRAEETQTAG